LTVVTLSFISIIEICRRRLGMEANVEIIISKQPFIVRINVDEKQWKEMEYFRIF